MPRVSVVMPVYNVGLYVEEAIEAFLAQTFTDFELLAVDDGSTDDTAAAVARMAERDARVRLIRRPHLGLNSTENHGFGLATGEFIVVADGDDVVLPEALAAQVEVLDRHPDTTAIGVWNRRFGVRPIFDRMPTEPRAIRRKLRRHWVLANPMMYRATALREIGGAREGVWSDDWDIWIRVAKRHDVRVVPRCLALVRSRPSSMTLQGSRYVSRKDKLQLRAHAIRVLGPDVRSLAALLMGLPAAALYGVFERFLSPVRRGPELAPRPPTISVVVPTGGRPDLLSRCLGGVAAQESPPDEVVVVHRPEDAETDEFLRHWTARDPERHRTATTEPGLVNALIAGTAATRCEVVAYLDDDAIPATGWLSELRRLFLDPRVGAAGGRLVDHVEGLPLTARTRRVGIVTWYGRIIFNHNRECDHYGEVDWLTGSNMAIRRNLAAHDPGLVHQSNGIAMANDLDVCLGVRRSGHRVMYSPWAVVEHHTTSFRDPALGSRVTGNDLVSSAANHAYALLKHTPSSRRPLLHLYGYAVGSASLAGPLRVVAEVLRDPRRAAAMARRMPLVWRGRRRGARMWRRWKREGRPVPAPPPVPERSRASVSGR